MHLAWMLRHSAVALILGLSGHSGARLTPAPRCPILGAVAATLNIWSVPTLDHSCSTASVLGHSPRPVPVLGGSGTRNLGALPHFGRKSSVFVLTYMHLSLFIVVVIIITVVIVVVSSLSPSLLLLPFSGGYCYLPCKLCNYIQQKQTLSSKLPALC